MPANIKKKIALTSSSTDLKPLIVLGLTLRGQINTPIDMIVFKIVIMSAITNKEVEMIGIMIHTPGTVTLNIHKNKLQNISLGAIILRNSPLYNQKATETETARKRTVIRSKKPVATIEITDIISELIMIYIEISISVMEEILVREDMAIQIIEIKGL